MNDGSGAPAGQDAGLRITITTGSPTPEEIAALTAAVAGIAAATPPPSPPLSPAWARAARMEAVGQAPFSDAADARLQAPSSRR